MARDYMEDFENIQEETTEIVEKVEEKVKEKVQKPKKATTQNKECKVLVYNAAKEFIIISFDGLGYKLPYKGENPGSTIKVKYTGKPGTSKFTISLV